MKTRCIGLLGALFLVIICIMGFEIAYMANLIKIIEFLFYTIV